MAKLAEQAERYDEMVRRDEDARWCSGTIDHEGCAGERRVVYVADSMFPLCLFMCMGKWLGVYGEEDWVDDADDDESFVWEAGRWRGREWEDQG